MKKIIFFVIMLVCSYNGVYASSNNGVMVNGLVYDNLEDAINNMRSGEEIKLLSDMAVEDTININKKVIIDLNNRTIEKDNFIFRVEGGELILKGKGVLKENKPYYSPIVIKGSNNINDSNYSIVTVGKDVTLIGWSGIFIDRNKNSNSSYGIKVDVDGTLKGVNDINNDEGIGVYVNGAIKNDSNYPLINLGKTSKIISSGVGIYNAGYAKINIDGADISGVSSGIAIKSGILNIVSGSIYAIGRYEGETEGNNNGVNSSGSSIQVESNSNYKGNIIINISGGRIESKNSYSFYEYIGSGSSTSIKEISINGGNFISKRDNFKLSNNFLNTHKHFITGGSFTSNISNYVKEGYDIKYKDNKYIIEDKMVMRNVDIDINNNKFIDKILSIVLIIITFMLSFIIAKRRRLHV